LVAGVLAALVERASSGRGQVVDAAMVDGSSLLMAMFHGLAAGGLWREERGSNLLDGGAPFYRCYRTADDGFMAVGALEPHFYAALIDGLGLAGEELPGQYDRDEWPALAARFEETFARRTRDEWSAIFEGTDACVAPVLSMSEAPNDPHAIARGGFIDLAGFPQPAPAPRFSRTPPPTPGLARRTGGDAEAVLERLGYDASDAAALLEGPVGK
jgi:alpha-methylacyl-CoA racemase